MENNDLNGKEGVAAVERGKKIRRTPPGGGEIEG